MIWQLLWKAIIMIVKGVLKVAAAAFWLTLELLKIFLLMFGLIFRIFLAFVDAGTP